MPIPPLNDDGLLPPGVHDCTLDELCKRFGQFQDTDRRVRLCKRFETYVEEIKRTGLVVAVVVNGSFVTGKSDPNDVDLILILPAEHEFPVELRPFEYNLLSRREVRRHHGFDVLLAVEGRAELSEYVEFFAQVRGMPGRRKGIVKVKL